MESVKSDDGRRCHSDGALAIGVPRDEHTARAHYSRDSNLLPIYYFVTFLLRQTGSFFSSAVVSSCLEKHLLVPRELCLHLFVRAERQRCRN